MGLAKGGKLWTSPSGLISPSTELWERGCAADGEKKTGDISKGKEAAGWYSVWKPWESSREEQQCQMPLRPHRCDHKILSKSRKQGNWNIKNKNSCKSGIMVPLSVTHTVWKTNTSYSASRLVTTAHVSLRLLCTFDQRPRNSLASSNPWLRWQTS